jgi:hypothetical protein
MGRRTNTSGARFWTRVIHWCVGQERGNVTPIMAIVLIPLVGAFAIATETSSWFLNQRSMQNAADSAALAAATNNTGGKTPANWDQEARGVATRYNYTSGVNNVTVTPTYPVTCPAPWTGNCYQVTISRDIPIRLARLIGYQGDVAMGGARGKTVSAIAIARPTGNGTYCLTALGAAADAISFKGAPSLDLTGCDIASAGGASCNGHSGDTVGHSYVANAGDNKDCGPNEIVTSAPADIYAGLASNITNPCGTRVANTVGAASWTSNKSYCGDVTLTGNITVTSDVVLTIGQGQLDIGNFNITTTGSGHLTILFTGAAGDGFSHIFTGNGTFDFAAPTSGPWSGVAIYQNPVLTTGVDISNVGNSPTYNVTGLLYLPHSDVSIKGAINHKTGGDNCMSLAANTIDIRGTGSIFAAPTSECDRAGLVLQGPPGTGSGPLLVQ